MALLANQPVFFVAFFQTKYKTIDEVRSKAPQAMSAHIARTKEFQKRGTLLMAGAFLNNPEEPVSTMAILISHEAAEEFAKGDPFVLTGMVSKWYIKEWANLLKS
jgi:uncharacterized protein